MLLIFSKIEIIYRSSNFVPLSELKIGVVMLVKFELIEFGEPSDI